jgi:hypothetical protein
VVTVGAAPGPGEVGPNPLTPAQARRLRATTRFSVGGGVRLRGLSPRRPAAGGCVVIVDGQRKVQGAAVLTDTGPKVGGHRFALWVPSSQTASTKVSSFADLQDQTWLLVEAGLTWNDVVDILSHSTIDDVSAFERAFLILNPSTGHRVSMTKFAAPNPPPTQPAPPARADTPGAELPAVTINDLGTAIQVLASVKEAYAAYECDYQRVLAAPALSDVTEDTTGAFVEAFNLAIALEPERPERCPPAHAARFVSAVAVAETAWETAEAHANRLGIAGYDPVQRTQIRRARQALDLALRADTPAGEREASLTAARRLLEGLVTLPAPLEAVITRAIPAASTPRAALEQ